MMCLGFEPGTAGWLAQTNPLSYGGPVVGKLTFFTFKMIYGHIQTTQNFFLKLLKNLWLYLKEFC